MDKVQSTFLIYEKELIPYVWSFEYDNGLINQLQFCEDDFPHLLGLDKLQKYTLMKSKNMPGVSSICLRDFKKGSITDEIIRRDKNRRLIERRINYFDNLPLLINDQQTQHFIFDKNIVPCSINAEYMLYNPINNTHCHFGTVETRATKGSNPKKYSPITWFIEEDRPDMYIKNQQRIILKNLKRDLK